MSTINHMIAKGIDHGVEVHVGLVDAHTVRVETDGDGYTLGCAPAASPFIAKGITTTSAGEAVELHVWRIKGDDGRKVVKVLIDGDVFTVPVCDPDGRPHEGRAD